MNLKVAYCPFPNDAALQAAAAQVVRAHNSKHTLDQFRDGVVVPGREALRSVGIFQQLYIIAHGSAGAAGIFDDNGGQLSVRDLAKQLRAQKLSTNVRKVKLFVCEGGAAGANSTASQLKQAMVAEGFNNLTVYGYELFLAQGALTEGGSKLAASEPSMDAAVITGAKSVRRKF